MHGDNAPAGAAVTYEDGAAAEYRPGDALTALDTLAAVFSYVLYQHLCAGDDRPAALRAAQCWTVDPACPARDLPTDLAEVAGADLAPPACRAAFTSSSR